MANQLALQTKTFQALQVRGCILTEYHKEMMELRHSRIITCRDCLLTPALPSAHCPPATIIGQFENLKEGYNKERNWNNRKEW
jgi:hypothetical protein